MIKDENIRITITITKEMNDELDRIVKGTNQFLGRKRIITKSNLILTMIYSELEIMKQKENILDIKA